MGCHLVYRLRINCKNLLKKVKRQLYLLIIFIQMVVSRFNFGNSNNNRYHHKNMTLYVENRVMSAPYRCNK